MSDAENFCRREGLFVKSAGTPRRRVRVVHHTMRIEGIRSFAPALNAGMMRRKQSKLVSAVAVNADGARSQR
jgi:hypothetical protein